MGRNKRRIQKRFVRLTIDNSLFLLLFLVFFFNSVYISEATLSPDECERGEYNSFNVCFKCPPGRYGSTTTNKTPQCTGNCPKGKYRSTPGAKSVDDCEFCPAGKYGSTEGERKNTCSGTCNPGKYSKVIGATDNTVCIDCPSGYYDYQCNYSKRDNPSNVVPSEFLNNR